MSGVALEAFPLKPLAQKLAMTTNGFSSFARALFRRFFEMPTKLHFAEDAFTLQFLFQGAKGLIYVIVAYTDLYQWFSPLKTAKFCIFSAEFPAIQ